MLGMDQVLSYVQVNLFSSPKSPNSGRLRTIISISQLKKLRHENINSWSNSWLELRPASGARAQLFDWLLLRFQDNKHEWHGFSGF